MDAAQVHETKAQHDARMQWWRDARFGMFIHWGLYSVPAGEWNGKTGYGEWIRESAQIPVGQYDQFLSQFNPTKFDADSWVKMARDAGMKYVVITTKHHDGFDLFKSKFSDFDIDSTPFKRDIMAEMAAACKKYGLKMCWYHSIMDWHHPDYLPRRTWEEATRPVDGANFNRYVQYLRNQVTELLTNYGPIGVMWFDGEWESTWNDSYGKPLYDLCRSLQPNVIVNNRVSNNRSGGMNSDGTDQRVGDFSTPEQTIPSTGLGDVDWETCMTMNDHWGYNSHDKNWKSSEELIHNVVDIASKGGNYLLNVGPRADGTFPPEAVARLHDIGNWMKENGNSIYDTKASLFDHLPWGRSTTKRNKDGTTTLFFHIFDYPADHRLVIPGLGNKFRSAHFASTAVMPVRVGSDVVIPLPKQPWNKFVNTVALTVVGEPVIYRTPEIKSDSADFVTTAHVSLESGSKGLEVRYTLDGSEPRVSSPRYTAPILLSKSTTIKAAAFDQGKKVSSVASKHFQKVNPWHAAKDIKPTGGLILKEYAGNWDRVPDFKNLEATKTSVAGAIGIPLKTPADERVGRLYTGYLYAPVEELYRFALLSDDGSKLWIDGKVVVDNDGLHSSETKVGFAPLAKGWHTLELRWFNATGASALDLRWSHGRGALATIAAKSFGH